MPTSTTPLLNVTDIQATATQERLDDVSKKVVTKMKVIAKRQEALDTFTAAHNAKVQGLLDAINAATTPEQIETALESKEFSFNERFYNFS